MTALITGASTGIGRDMAIYLSTLGYDLILVARNRNKLLKLKKLLPVKVKVIAADLSDPENAKRIYYVCRSVKIPVYAIGGISPENIAAVRAAGAKGACVMSGAMTCEDPAAFLASFKEIT